MDGERDGRRLGFRQKDTERLVGFGGRERERESARVLGVDGGRVGVLGVEVRVGVGSGLQVIFHDFPHKDVSIIFTTYFAKISIRFSFIFFFPSFFSTANKKKINFLNFFLST